MAHATTRTTLGSLLGLITVTAGSLTKGVSVIDTGFTMAHTAAEDAKRRQAARSTLDAHTYQETILREKVMELELQQESIEDWIAEKPDRKDRFNASYNTLKAALTSTRT